MIKINCSISKCNKYRWSLDLEISDVDKKLIFIGLNPSLSNKYFLDNTTKKILKISNKNNYGKVKIINLFGLISKDPKLLFLHKDPNGKFNNKVIKESIQYWSLNSNCNIWLGWGNNGFLLNRNRDVYELIKKYFYLKKNNFNNPSGPLLIKKTKHNNPIHPLYCSNDSILNEDCSILEVPVNKN